MTGVLQGASYCPQWVESGQSAYVCFGWKADTNASNLRAVMRLSLVVLLGCLAGCTTPKIGTGTVTVMKRPIYAVCTGVCPNIDVTVRPDGWITLSRHKEEAVDVKRRRVGPQRAKQFSAALSHFRPTAKPGRAAHCAFWDADDPLVLKVYPFEVIWAEADGSVVRRASCGDDGDTGFREAIGEALGSVDFRDVH